MSDLRRSKLINLPDAAQGALIAGARDIAPVRGLTHGFYKYPARFSPAFVRAAIKTFTKPGDLCLDPHVGGGTTLVEALATGRDAVGVDISTLAEFVAKVKSTVFSEAELERLALWVVRLPNAIDIHKRSTEFSDHAELGYYKHLDHRSRWRLRKAIEQGMGSAIRLGTPRLESFGRCVVLRTAQWALDGRMQHTTVDEFRDFLAVTAAEMVEGARELRAAVTANGSRPIIEIFQRTAAGLEDDARMKLWRARDRPEGDRGDRGAHQHPDDRDVRGSKPEAARPHPAGRDVLRLGCVRGQINVRFRTTADNRRFWPAMACPLLTQSGHWLAAK